MSITHPIGYPTHDPMRNPKEHPNRPRIARIESSRIVSSPLPLWSPFIHDVQYVSARAATEPSDTHQPHATATAWMRADR